MLEQPDDSKSQSFFGKWFQIFACEPNLPDNRSCGVVHSLAAIAHARAVVVESDNALALQRRLSSNLQSLPPLVLLANHAVAS